MIQTTNKRARLVGEFIRKRREELGLSQRALGAMFDPAVTTQFISNVERGVTPLPPAHIPVLAKALNISEAEIMSLLEREYAIKLNGRLGREDSVDPSSGNGHSNGNGSSHPALSVNSTDFDFMKSLYEAYQHADPKTRQAFAQACESMLKVSKSSSAQ